MRCMVGELQCRRQRHRQEKRRKTRLLRNRRQRQAAFTIIDLMLAVTILGILAAIGTQRYSAYIAQSKRTEAYAAIDALWNAQEAFYAENGVYNPNLLTIGFGMDQGDFQGDLVAMNEFRSKYYTYVVSVDPNTAQEWMVRATSENLDGDDFPDIIVGGNFSNFTVE